MEKAAAEFVAISEAVVFLDISRICRTLGSPE